MPSISIIIYIGGLKPVSGHAHDRQLGKGKNCQSLMLDRCCYQRLVCDKGVEMSNSLSQMQMLYVSEEDRILFRVNSTSGEEFRFWLTRRYVLLLTKVLKDYADKDPDVCAQVTPAEKNAVEEFKQEKRISDANFTMQFTEESSSYPLGESILLAFKLSFSIKDTILQLSIQPKEGRGINFVINQEINASMIQLLKTAAEKGGWGIQNAFATRGQVTRSSQKRVIN